MVARARPGILLGELDEASTDGVVLDETDLFEDARVVQDAGEKPPPPEVAGHVLFAVEVLGVLHVERVEGPGEGAVGLGDAYVVDVGRHQAVGPDIDAVACRAFGEPLEVELEIRILLEDPLLVVPPLGDLVGIAGNGDSS